MAERRRFRLTRSREDGAVEVFQLSDSKLGVGEYIEVKEVVEASAAAPGEDPIDVLRDLVRLKDGPRDDAYRAQKDAVWERARALLAADRPLSREAVEQALLEELKTRLRIMRRRPQTTPNDLRGIAWAEELLEGFDASS